MKLLLLAIFTLLTLSACSKEVINENVDSITSDIVNAFEGSRDTSQEQEEEK
jgi:hypothetical protein